MIIRLLASLALFGIGYALGKEMGRTEEIRREQKRLDPYHSHRVRVIDHSGEEFEDAGDSHPSSIDR